MRRDSGKKTAQIPGGDVDLSEEEMERSVSGLLFALDSTSIAPSLQLNNSALTVTFRNSGAQAWGHDLCSPLPQVCADVEILRGQYYWEIDVCNSALYRIGVKSLAGDEAWWFERRGSGFRAVFDGRQELLAVIPSIFTPPLRPAFQLGQGRLKLCPGLPPPKHIFLSCSSAYWGPEGAGLGRWRPDVGFGSVKAVIQKFEEMSISDSDSGLMSGYSSNSTLSITVPSPESSSQHTAQEH